MAFDGEMCIKLLCDKSKNIVDRIAAAESLIHYPKPQTCEALCSIILDNSEDYELREEAIECLASLWYEIGYDKKELDSIPEPFRAEVLREIELNKSAEQQNAPDPQGRAG